MCGKFAVYFKLTDLNGKYEFEVAILAPDLATIVGKIAFRPVATVADPIQPLDHSGNLMLPVPGRYAVRLMYNALVLDEFSVEATEQP